MKCTLHLHNVVIVTNWPYDTICTLLLNYYQYLNLLYISSILITEEIKELLIDCLINGLIKRKYLFIWTDLSKHRFRHCNVFLIDSFKIMAIKNTCCRTFINLKLSGHSTPFIIPLNYCHISFPIESLFFWRAP